MTHTDQAQTVSQVLDGPYRHGFVTDIESDALPPGLDEGAVRAISRKKREPDFLLQLRLKALALWQTLEPSHWAQLRINPIDFQALCYYSAPKSLKDGPKSLADGEFL